MSLKGFVLAGMVLINVIGFQLIVSAIAPVLYTRQVQNITPTPPVQLENVVSRLEKQNQELDAIIEDTVQRDAELAELEKQILHVAE